MPPTDLAWLAGLLEGEGCFTCWETKPGRWCVRVYLKMTDLDVVERAQALMEAKYIRPTKTKDGNKQAWETSIAGAAAGTLMRLLYPFMGERRQGRIDDLLRLEGTHN